MGRNWKAPTPWPLLTRAGTVASDTKAGQPSPSREASKQKLWAGGTNPSSVSYCVTSSKLCTLSGPPTAPSVTSNTTDRWGCCKKLTGITQQRAWPEVTMPVMAIITAFLSLLFLSVSRSTAMEEDCGALAWRLVR